ncbi:MAG: methyltransferase domain-containing protein [Alphaproteobacteria bacterium]|nr:methyltransferase domain-containing protein [Alphaproteobacteria bacterium]
MSRADPARDKALAILAAVLERRQPLDAWMGVADDLPARDRAFVRLMVLTVLRRLGQIDAALAAALDRPDRRLPTSARLALRLGAAQLLYLGTPAHAAVDAAAAQAGRVKAMRGLVNAVLRRIAGKPPAEADALLNLPDWLRARWLAHYGEDATRAILAVHRAEPPLDLSVKQDAAGWAARLGGRVLASGTVRIERAGAIEALAGFAEGAWWVQDAAAALPAALLGDVAGKRVLDLCAAPGGKTAQLAAAGARVTALDRSEPRMALLRANLERLNLAAECVVADAESWRASEPFPMVLLDAPCSATGTVRRHPDIPWTKRAEDIVRLVALQERLLEAAVESLAPGGTLVYAVCSLEPEEGPERIAALLARRPDLALDPIATLPLAVTLRQGELRSLPSDLAVEGGVDGFYAARLKRDTRASKLTKS